MAVSLRKRGMRGTADRALYYVWLYLTPGGSRERHFDLRFGVETSGVISSGALGSAMPNSIYATEYSTASPRRFMRILQELGLNYSDWQFIDIGAGKGKVMLLASQFPFKQVIGVEFVPALARIASDNIKAYRNPAQQCQCMSVVCGDAAEYQIPVGKSIIFLNNPFFGPVLERVMGNIGNAVCKHGSEVYVVYWNPFCARVLDRAPFLATVKSRPQYRVYRSVRSRA